MQYFPHRFFDPSSHVLQFVSALVLRRATGGGGGGAAKEETNVLLTRL